MRFEPPKVTCYSCVWSIGTIDGLWCKQAQVKADQLCSNYMREMGADEREEVDETD